jgi:hypothetical protein
VAAAGLKILPHAQIFIYVLYVQTFAMVDGHYGAVVDGVFTSADGGSGFAASAPVPIEWLSSGAVVTITLTGKSCWFSVAIASKNALNNDVHRYNNNHHAAFHYSSLWGRVNSNWDYSGGRVNSDAYFEEGEFAVHRTRLKTPFTATLTLRGSDRTVSFSVNGVPQRGVWALPATDAFYLMLGTFDGEVVVTDVTVANLV